jgi:hypothetical protein
VTTQSDSRSSPLAMQPTAGSGGRIHGESAPPLTPDLVWTQKWRRRSGYDECQVHVDVPLPSADADTVRKCLKSGTKADLEKAKELVTAHEDPNATPVFARILELAFEDNRKQVQEFGVIPLPRPLGTKVPNLLVVYDTGVPEPGLSGHAAPRGFEIFRVQCEIRIKHPHVSKQILRLLEEGTPESLAEAERLVTPWIDSGSTSLFRHIVRLAFDDNRDPGKPPRELPSDEARSVTLVSAGTDAMLLEKAAAKAGDLIQKIAEQLRDRENAPQRTAPLFFPNGIELVAVKVAAGIGLPNASVDLHLTIAGAACCKTESLRGDGAGIA